ncbi:hypothetical protein SBDP1_1020007 [Syntrophobacter sp. SbD1]|nr:hypothetical protein SBDP1_1020007 [Syntrophobacter sp. SbD1]
MNQTEKNVSSNNFREIPESLRPFFWDVDFEGLSVQNFSYFIISRLMEHGDDEALRFLMRTYSRRELGETLSTSRSISRRSRKFWALLLNIKEESCSAKRYPTPFGDCSWD